MRRSWDINVIFTSMVEEIAALCARSKVPPPHPHIPVVFTLPENDSININIILADRREDGDQSRGRSTVEMHGNDNFNVESIWRK